MLQGTKVFDLEDGYGRIGGLHFTYDDSDASWDTFHSRALKEKNGTDRYHCSMRVRISFVPLR